MFTNLKDAKMQAAEGDMVCPVCARLIRRGDPVVLIDGFWVCEECVEEDYSSGGYEYDGILERGY